ncbi:SRPBCC family protein [Streptomyces luteoverticillatus]|uniref:SRPBCC family protein n=1 Tax=Streptomyces luteoverticillatus TaxID=66425 RepID=A0A3S9PDC4_STRLT|nr:SRPBCC family protein [Streptomyces luteoverticillatus]AZQ70419.1 SRPBCC family protein [Streptomyces luteoverticillatus]
MRYADGPGVHDEVHIGAAPAEVWRLVADIGLPARISTELQRVEWLDGATGPALGAAFEGHNRHPMAGEWRTVSHIVALEPERLFTWAVTDPDNRFGGGPADPALPLATWKFELLPEDGGTLLRQSVRVGPAPSGLSVAISRMPDREEQILAMRLGELREGIRATLEGVKRLAEPALDGGADAAAGAGSGSGSGA